MIQWFCDLQKLNMTELSEYVLQFLPNIVILFVHPSINEVCIVCCVCMWCVCTCVVCMCVYVCVLHFLEKLCVAYKSISYVYKIDC